MAFVSQKMLLRIWNQLSDPYDHNQLADNLMRIDQHDHTPGRGVQIPTEGIADGAITSSKLATGGVVAVPGDGSVTPSSISPALMAYFDGGFGAYKAILPPLSIYTQGGTNISGQNYVFHTLPLASPANAAFISATAGVGAWYLNSADYAVTTDHHVVYRIAFAVACDQGYAGNLTVNMMSLTPQWSSSNGGTGNYWTTASAVGGSTVVASSLPAFSTQRLLGNDFTPPAAGFYALTVNPSVGTINAGLTMQATLQMRQVPN